jgi:hypothetical protein
MKNNDHTMATVFNEFSLQIRAADNILGNLTRHQAHIAVQLTPVILQDHSFGKQNLDLLL